MITAVTLNTSIDKAYQVEDVEKGTVMRVKSCNNTAGGKGLNVARVIQICGEEILATGFCGGHAGALLEEMLSKAGIAYDFVHTAKETRNCLNILSRDGVSTEFLEPGEPVTEEEIEAFLKKYEALVDKSNVITLSGSIPQGAPPDIYATLIRIAKDRQKTVILDTSGPALTEGIKALPDMIKPNADEIETLLNISITNRNDIIQGAVKLHDMGIPYVVVSLGKEGAVCVSKEGILKAAPPAANAINTVGCGDSMVAAFAVSFERRYPLQQALKYAVAVSAANTLTPTTGHYRPEDMQEIYSLVEVEIL
ncbi:1-phosphofructokinase [Diplocloster agilis]|uniref:1-phosphofructokinase n=1 Tax=Diplocloster agilis TaxID=2850323 RepID=UPI000822E4D9|nr:1-phosphofructokinase [Suonthocola fibrivorans]MCU6736509.1 1-phosphofructokinase [Suonthocola fibrivorans]SCJ91218.1 Tagatose-6-phosphate kinase [uncultured Clostridium sp.]